MEARGTKGCLDCKEPEDLREVFPYQDQRVSLGFLEKQGCQEHLEEMEYLGCQEPRVKLDLARMVRLDKKERGANLV